MNHRALLPAARGRTLPGFRAVMALALVATAGMLEAQETLTSTPEQIVTRVGTRGATFLALGVGARGQALGGAYGAAADDITSLYWNTAAMSRIDGFSAGMTTARLFEELDIQHTFVGVVMPFGFSRLGVSVNTLDSGEMPWQSEYWPNAGYGGEQDPTAAAFAWTATAIGLHFAQPITDRLTVGLAGKVVEEGITNATASYVGVDLSTVFRTGLYGVTIAASLTNLGTSGRFEGQLLNSRVNTSFPEGQIEDFIRVMELSAATDDLELPTSFRFSVMADLIGGADAILSPDADQSLRLMADINDPVDAPQETALGIEYGFRGLAFVRAGKRFANEDQIDHGLMHAAAAGGGVRLPVGELGTLSVDYAYTSMEQLENIQVFSFQLQF